MDRRERKQGDPPTLLMRSFTEMEKEEKWRFQKVGLGLLFFTAAVPMIAGIFYELSPAYWVFSGLMAIVGVCLAWLPLGVWLLSSVPNALTKMLPGHKLTDLLKRPDRRERDEDDDDCPE